MSFLVFRRNMFNMKKSEKIKYSDGLDFIVQSIIFIDKLHLTNSFIYIYNANAFQVAFTR